jgi:hypothetical protein
MEDELLVILGNIVLVTVFILGVIVGAALAILI